MSRCLRNCPSLRSGQFRGQKSRDPLKMSREMAHKVIVPKKKLCPLIAEREMREIVKNDVTA
jgi:hypothetical protein